MIDESHLRIDHVANCDDRKIEAPCLAGGRVKRSWTGRAQAATKDVRTDDKEPVGIDRLAGSDERFPPAGFARHRVDVGDVLIAGECVANQNGVRLGSVEVAVSLVGNHVRVQALPAVELQRHRHLEHVALRRRNRRRHADCHRRDYGLFKACHRFLHSSTSPLGVAGRSVLMRSARPFSELFNVAASRSAKSPRS